MSAVYHTDHEVSKFLTDNISLLPKGRVLDVAMGRGRNAVYLAKMGFQVEGIDVSHEAVNNAMELARISGVDIRGIEADLEGDYSIKNDAYDVIICFNYLQRPLIPDIKNGLRIGGMIVYETFIVDQAQFDKPRNPRYLLQHNELLRMFRDFRCLLYHEGIIDKRRAVAGIIAEKIGGYKYA